MPFTLHNSTLSDMMLLSLLYHYASSNENRHQERECASLLVVGINKGAP